MLQLYIFKFAIYNSQVEFIFRVMKKKILFLVVFGFLANEISAQCAMCRAVLESEEGQTTAAGVNDGIMYLMAIPYILIGGIGLIIYLQFFRNKKSEKTSV